MLRIVPLFCFSVCYFYTTMADRAYSPARLRPVCLLKSAGFTQKKKKLSLSLSILCLFLPDSICQHSTSEAHYISNYYIVW
jgi:hypothetical protein